jgi:flagellin
MNLLAIVNSSRTKQANVLTQLSTGYKINRGADNPAGLIALKSLEAELTGISAAIDNNQRSDAMLSVADNAVNEISSLLGEIETLVMASASDAGLSAGEKAANQAQIDQALASIDRIVNTTNFNGKRLLDGSQGIAIAGTPVDASKINSLRIYSRGNSSTNTDVKVSVTKAATQASAVFNTMGSNTLTADTTLEVSGSLGTRTVELASGASVTEVVAAINEAKGETGVEATSATGGKILLQSSGYGDDEFMTVNVLKGGTHAGTDFASMARTEGVDAEVTINGVSASVDGLDVYHNANGLSLSFTVDKDNFNSVGNYTFTVSATKGGATFQLGTSSSTRATIGIDSLATHRIGQGVATETATGGKKLDLSDLRSGGFASVDTDTGKALMIVRKAMTDVAQAQGRIGAFQKFNVQTSINSLNAAKVSLTDAKSVVGDTDFAEATAELNRQSVLLNSGISLLGLANQQASQILSLLG